MDTQKLDARGYSALKRLMKNPESLAALGNKMRARTHSASLTGSYIGQLPVLDAEDLASVYERARLAQVTWALRPLDERVRIIRKFEKLVWKNEEALLDLEQWENGKARGHAFEEVADVAMNASYYARTASKHLKDRKVKGAVPFVTKAFVHRTPRGVVSVITPWNYPLTLAASDALPALIAGNAVVIKPDSATPYIGLAVKSLLIQAGLPDDVFQVVLGSGSVLGSKMIELGDFLMFTGSTATGAKVAAQAGEALIDVSAELGGKNPMYIRADAPVDRAARAAVKACFANAGQLCISIERMYVHADVWDEFVEAFLGLVKGMKVTADMDWSADMGPLLSEDQLSKVETHVSDAVAKGATVLAGGTRLPDVSPRAYAPTVLTDVTPEMTLFAEETFGPVVSLYKVESDDEAILAANSTKYGLNSAIWTGDLSEGEALARQIQAGTVNVNDGYTAAWAATDGVAGGVKQSGLGGRHGAEGILKYTDAHLVAVQRVMAMQAPEGMGEKRWAKTMGRFLKFRGKLPF